MSSYYRTPIIGYPRPVPPVAQLDTTGQGMVESPGYQVMPGFTQGVPAAPGGITGASTPPASTSSGFDIGGLLSGQIFGLPAWLVLGAAAWFLFFRKRR